MKIEIILSFVVAMTISAFLVPLVKYVGDKLGIIAFQNERTIHNGRMVRIGGYAIYLGFIISVLFFLKTDTQINSILIAGFIVFFSGLYDDIHCLSPKVKLLFQIIAASIVMFYGRIMLRGIVIPYMPSQLSDMLSIIITYGWIIGITNAINLIDGLDGLSSGISSIVLVTLSFTSLHFGRVDIAALSLLLAGATVGFLFYNFHPASIFMGDSGALFLGFMIAVISLLGFGYKSSTFFTLGAPIIVLAVPIMDTLMAIMRRKLRKKKFSDADREHLHHQLMFNLNLGQKRSVLILYGATILFSLSSYIYLYDKMAAVFIFILLIIGFEIFVEYTQMISRKYRPLLTLINFFIRSEKLPVLSDPEPEIETLKDISVKIIEENESQTKYYQRRARAYERKKRMMKNTRNNKVKRRVIWVSVLSMVTLFAVGTVIFLKNQEKPEPVIEAPVDDGVNYTLSVNPTVLMQEIFDQLKLANEQGDQEKEMTYAAAYFATDFFTWSNKREREDIGGMNYVWPKVRQDFASFALRDYYANFTEYASKYEVIHLPEVESYVINGINESLFKLETDGDTDKPCYDISIDIIYKEDMDGMPTASLKSSMVITVVKDVELYYVVGIDYEEA